jgi:hypothetical protein
MKIVARRRRGERLDVQNDSRDPTFPLIVDESEDAVKRAARLCRSGSLVDVP